MRSGSDFTVAVRRGRRAGRRSVVVHRLDRADPGLNSLAPLVGFIVPRSVGSAGVRTRVQRRHRQLMRARVQSLPPGCLLVVRAQPAASRAPELATDLDRALGAVGSAQGGGGLS